jgi:hypothetical protein
MPLTTKAGGVFHLHINFPVHPDIKLTDRIGKTVRPPPLCKFGGISPCLSHQRPRRIEEVGNHKTAYSN